MVDFLYDFFYEVLSEEGIWVLILIGAGFAVASFILLMMKIETGPRQRRVATNSTVTETIESPVPVKKKKIKLKKNKSTNNESTEEQDSGPAMPVRPQMVRPDDVEPNTTEPATMEQVDMEMMDPDGFNIPALPETGDQSSPLSDSPMPSVPRGTVQEHPGTELSPEAVDAMAVEDAPATDAVETVKNEEEDDEQKEEKSDASDIFDIFTDVEEEESGISEFAKNLDDVTINGLLSETEELSEELKNMFTKHRRA